MTHYWCWATFLNWEGRETNEEEGLNARNMTENIIGTLRYAKNIMKGLNIHFSRNCKTLTPEIK